MNILNVFNDDAFTASTLTGQILAMDHVPGRAGELVFAGISEGIPTTAVTIERQNEELTLLPTTARGAPAPQQTMAKRELLGFEVPQIKLEQTIYAHSIQDIAGRFGTDGNAPPVDAYGDRLRGATSAVNNAMNKMTRRHDLTLEHHRLGALKGVIADADGSVLVDLYEEFGFLNSDGFAAPEEFAFDLGDWTQSTFAKNLRAKCSEVIRAMRRAAKMEIPSTALVWALTGDNFHDKLLEHPSVKKVYDGTAAAKQRLGDSYVSGVFEFGNVFFENYQGTDDNSTVAIDPDEARFFFTGIPELYSESFAPADFLETTNKQGLPRYAKLALDPQFQQWVKLHTQQNPLPLCLRPQTLMRAT
jgi:hypothetical protein